MRVLLWLCLLGISTPLRAAQFTMTTEQGHSFSLESSAARLTTNTNWLLLCGPQIQAVSFVKLWMPDHGHGSTPVQLSTVDGQCRAMSRVNFTMPGTWEVIVDLGNVDKGRFSIPVSRR